MTRNDRRLVVDAALFVATANGLWHATGDSARVFLIAASIFFLVQMWVRLSAKEDE